MKLARGWKFGLDMSLANQRFLIHSKFLAWRFVIAVSHTPVFVGMGAGVESHRRRKAGNQRFGKVKGVGGFSDGKFQKNPIVA